MYHPIREELFHQKEQLQYRSRPMLNVDPNMHLF